MPENEQKAPLDMEAIKRRATFDSGHEAHPLWGYGAVARNDGGTAADPDGIRHMHDALLDRRDLIAEVERLSAAFGEARALIASSMPWVWANQGDETAAGAWQDRAVAFIKKHPRPGK